MVGSDDHEICEMPISEMVQVLVIGFKQIICKLCSSFDFGKIDILSAAVGIL